MAISHLENNWIFNPHLLTMHDNENIKAQNDNDKKFEN